MFREAAAVVENPKGRSIMVVVLLPTRERDLRKKKTMKDLIQRQSLIE
jgi:hypothetical protein